MVRKHMKVQPIMSNIKYDSILGFIYGEMLYMACITHGGLDLAPTYITRTIYVSHTHTTSYSTQIATCTTERENDRGVGWEIRKDRQTDKDSDTDRVGDKRDQESESKRGADWQRNVETEYHSN